MADVRVIAWNIKDFKGSTFAKHGNRIMNVLYTGANRNCDVFVIVEPFSKMKKFGVGALVTEGAGLDGVLALYFALAAKDPAWKVVPLRAACKPPKSDMVAVYYYSRLVDFQGPDDINGVNAIVTKTATPGGQVLPWNAATAKAGQVRFYDATPAEIVFHGRRPYLCTFNLPERVTRTYSLTVNAAAGGNAAIGTNALPDGVQGELYLFAMQATAGVAPFTWAAGGATNLPNGLLFGNNGKLTGTPTQTGAFTLQAGMQDNTGAIAAPVTINFNIAAAGGGLAFQTAANLPAAIAGQPYEITLVTKGGTGARTTFHVKANVATALPAGMTLGTDGKLVWNNPATAGSPHSFDVEVVDSTNRGFKLVGIHAPPDARYPNNVDMVENLAQILEITTNRGGVPVAVCGDFNVCPVVLHPNKCYDKVHKQREGTALNPLAATYASGNGNKRTGLKSAAKAGKDAYAAIRANGVLALDDITSHAYDHVLTIGFNAVNNVDTVDLVRLDPGFNQAQTDATNQLPNPIKGLIKKYCWSNGVSDHYPVKFTLDVV